MVFDPYRLNGIVFRGWMVHFPLRSGHEMHFSRRGVLKETGLPSRVRVRLGSLGTYERLGFSGRRSLVEASQWCHFLQPWWRGISSSDPAGS